MEETFTCSSHYDLEIINKALDLFVATIKVQEFSIQQMMQQKAALGMQLEIARAKKQIEKNWAEKSV